MQNRKSNASVNLQSCLDGTIEAAQAAGRLMRANWRLPKKINSQTQRDIKLELDFDKAPKTAENFKQYVDSGFYDGTIFHRVINNFMIQGGGFTEDMAQKSTNDPIENEADNGLANDEYTVAMARTMDPIVFWVSSNSPPKSSR